MWRMYGVLFGFGKGRLISVAASRMNDGEVFKLVLALDQSEKWMDCNVVGFVW